MKQQLRRTSERENINEAFKNVFARNEAIFLISSLRGIQEKQKIKKNRVKTPLFAKLEIVLFVVSLRFMKQSIRT